jgi:hypothetical protein
MANTNATSLLSDPTFVVGIAPVIVQVVTGIIAKIRARKRATDPNAPEPTSEEVIAEFRAQSESVIAEGEAWLAAHPRDEHVG